MKKRFIAIIILLLTAVCVHAQLTVSPSSDNGSGYPAIEGAGLGIESPDCEHTSFGAHITQLYDATLDRNVFAFHSHIDADNDRCLNFDRVRMEIKGGPNTDAEAQHEQGETSYYRWKFRLSEDFVGASSFCHLFQNKARGGSDDSFPVLTITARTDRVELRHDGGDTGTDLGVVAEADLSHFLGRWVEAYIMQLNAEAGMLEVTLKDMLTGQVILSYSDDNIDLWRSGAEYNRPKWGVYRAKSTVLQDEVVRFADFCISETSADLCPAEAVLLPDTTPPSAPANLLLTNTSITTATLQWESSTDDFGVADYVILQDGLEVAVTTDLQATIENLSGGTTYIFTVVARDEAGNVSGPSNELVATTDPTDALPDVAANPFPANGASEVLPQTTLTWISGNNTDNFRLFFGTNAIPSEVGMQTNTTYTPTLESNTTYYWQVVAINANGETSGPVWSFTTGELNEDYPWYVYRANARLEQEASYWTLESIPPSPDTDEVTSDLIVASNNLYSYRYDGDEKFRWRTALNEQDSVITIVARLMPFSDDVNGMCHFEVRIGGWRQKVRLNDGNIKLEASTPVVERDLNFDWDDDLHLFRMVVRGSQTTIYLDEDPTPFLVGTSDEATSLNYFDWGKGGATDYGATIDWLAFDRTGAYAPGMGAPLPADLILSNDATLTSLSLDNVPLADFDPHQLDYTVMLSSPELPMISWQTGSPLATVEAINPSTPEGDQATIRVMAQDGVSESVYTLHYLLTSTQWLGESNSIAVFPNPASGMIQVVLPAEQTATGIIFNSQGECVRHQLAIQHSKYMDVSDLPPGGYVLRVQLGDGAVQVRTFIIQ